MSNEIQKRYVIVVGVDFSKTGELALQRALELAAETPGGEPHVVNVLAGQGPNHLIEGGAAVGLVTAAEAEEGLKKYVGDQLAVFEGKHGKRFDRAITHQRVGAPADGIAQLASDLEADLVVVGTHGYRALSRLLLGSVAESTVRLAHCPVLVVRPKEQTSAQEPKILPPCPQCVEERRRTLGKELWCAMHREHHGRRHTIHHSNRLSESRENASLLVRT